MDGWLEDQKFILGSHLAHLDSPLQFFSEAVELPNNFFGINEAKVVASKILVKLNHVLHRI